MKVAKLTKTYKANPADTVTNEYPTTHYMLYSPCVMIINGLRNSGKSFLTAKVSILNNIELSSASKSQPSSKHFSNTGKLLLKTDSISF